MLGLAKDGFTNAEIAAQLGISRDAVRYHVKELHSKLETSGDRQQLKAQETPFGLLSLILGVARAASVAATPAVVASAFGLAALAFVAYGGRDQSADANDRKTTTYMSWDGAVLDDFTVPGRISLDELTELNPTLGPGPLQGGIAVIVPVLEGGDTIWLVPTPTSAP